MKKKPFLPPEVWAAIAFVFGAAGVLAFAIYYLIYLIAKAGIPQPSLVWVQWAANALVIILLFLCIWDRNKREDFNGRRGDTK